MTHFLVNSEGLFGMIIVVFRDTKRCQEMLRSRYTLRSQKGDFLLDMSSLLHQLRHPSEGTLNTSIDPFVLDFCQFWVDIFDAVQQERIPKISKTAILTRTFQHTHTQPFYEKYKAYDFVECFPAYWDRLGAICFQWKGGWIAFPLRLITYELAHPQENLVATYLHHLTTGTLPGDRETLFAFLFPRLYQIALPLSDYDVHLLKGFQLVFNRCANFFRGPTIKEFVTHLPHITPETIRNKLEHFQFFQFAIDMFYPDMGKLGYETHLISHVYSLPTDLEPYRLSTVNFGRESLSLLQLPTATSALFAQLRSFLDQDTTPSAIFEPLTWRTHSWNLTHLTGGHPYWKLPVKFFYSDLHTAPQTSSPTLDISLIPMFDPFRPLTPADLKLLAFLTTVGNTIRVKDMCTQLQLHHKTVVQLMAEYCDHQLLHRVVQFFNIGLDLSASLYVEVPRGSQAFPFLQQCLTLPRVDMFLTENKTSSIYYGQIDMPSIWIKEFVTRMRTIRDTFPDISLHYTFERPSPAKWNLSLAETYSRPL
jgi:hypothetical protein